MARLDARAGGRLQRSIGRSVCRSSGAAARWSMAKGKKQDRLSVFGETKNRQTDATDRTINRWRDDRRRVLLGRGRRLVAVALFHPFALALVLLHLIEFRLLFGGK